MESAPVNWEALDALVIDFAKSENLIEDSSNPSSSSFASSSSPSSVHSSPSPTSSPSPSPSMSSASYHSRLIIRQIRRSLESGDVDSAIDLLRANAPFVLDDHRLLFRLQKQKFIELLRRGTMEDRDSAIKCLRHSLAPCALDAYPEAYEEFKHVLLAFVYDKDDQSSPVANEWSERRRLDIAGLLSTVLRANLHAYDPIFSMTLRYLISIHKGFCFRQGMLSPISDLTERLLLEERDPPTTPQETLYEAPPPFDEVDIQALAHAVELTRQNAVDSLRFSKGDLFQAFQNELCRMKLDASMLDELVREYCIYRGIVDSVLSPHSASGVQTLSKPFKVEKLEDGSCPSKDLSLEVDSGANKNSDGHSSISEARVDGSPEKNADATSMQRVDVELRYASEPTIIHEDCSTSGSHQPENHRIQLKSKISVGERNKRKRWRGRHDDSDCARSFSVDESSKQELSTSVAYASHGEQGLERHSNININNRDEKYEIVLGMKELASKGMAAEVVDEVNALDPNFFVQNPSLLFQLKQVEFLKLVSSSDYSGALKVACTHLGPLAASDPTLLKPLKETLLALLHPIEDALEKALPLNALANTLQVAIGKKLGIEEPQLMKIIRTTLHSHNEWFKLQMCKDRFEGLLRIDSLKESNPTSLTSAIATSKMNTERSSVGSPQATLSSSSRMSEDSSPTLVSSRDVICDENAILKVMEFLELPRADAIHLLAQYNGNAETAIQQIYA